MRGVQYPFGSREENLAITSFVRNQSIQFMTTLTIVNAIISVGNGIMGAISGGSSSNNDTLKKSIEALRELLLPENEEDRKKRDKRIIDILASEASKGPLVVRKMSSGTSIRDKGRIKRRRRSSVDGTEGSES